jgi:hypothetical protein
MHRMLRKVKTVAIDVVVLIAMVMPLVLLLGFAAYPMFVAFPSISLIGFAMYILLIIPSRRDRVE